MLYEVAKSVGNKQRELSVQLRADVPAAGTNQKLEDVTFQMLEDWRNALPLDVQRNEHEKFRLLFTALIKIKRRDIIQKTLDVSIPTYI